MFHLVPRRSQKKMSDETTSRICLPVTQKSCNCKLINQAAN